MSETSTRAEATYQDLNRVRDYYCSPRSVAEGELNIYEIWERGGAMNDSVTPSTYSPEYRNHMVLKLLSLTSYCGNIFSLGCGNAVVEGDLVNLARNVAGIDCNEVAVKLARDKGVDAYGADYFHLASEVMKDVELVYADGFIGHLFHDCEKLDPVFRKLNSLNLRRGTRLVLSNDAPRDPSVGYAPHDHIDGFWFVSKDYVQDELRRYGFESIESYYFPYSRPISGPRNRTICVAQVI